MPESLSVRINGVSRQVVRGTTVAAAMLLAGNAEPDFRHR